jgi:hypothetical protein
MKTLLLIGAAVVLVAFGMLVGSQLRAPAAAATAATAAQSTDIIDPFKSGTAVDYTPPPVVAENPPAADPVLEELRRQDQQHRDERLQDQGQHRREQIDAANERQAELDRQAR